MRRIRATFNVDPYSADMMNREDEVQIVAYVQCVLFSMVTV